MNGGTKKAPQETDHQSRPSLLAMFSSALMALVVSLGSATASYAILADIWGAILVFMFALLILMTVVPYLLLVSGLVNESTWFKSYVMVMKKIPGL